MLDVKDAQVLRFLRLVEGHIQAKKVSSMTTNIKKPVLITVSTQTDRLETQREMIAQTLSDLMEAVQETTRDVRAGDFGNKVERAKALNDLKYWLKAARETELELEAIKRKQLGIDDAYGLDLEAADDAIGCRLAMLRPCCATEDVSE